MKDKLIVAFSGGRTSAYMCWWLLNNKADDYEFIFVFANTGQEHEKTLDFVNQCDDRFRLNLIWLEAEVNHGKNIGSTHKIVSYKTAARNGEPFKEVIKKYGIPNADWPHCNREMKINPVNSYMRSIGLKTKTPRAIGIRSDEADRMNIKAAKDASIVYPLIKWHPITKEEIRHWWSAQDFDLEVPEHLGNCVTCWKKSNRKLMTIAKNEPERFDFFKSMEKYKNISPREEERVFFRGFNTVDDIFEMAESDFVEFKDNMPELQIRLLDPIDYSNGCSDSCEVA